MSTSTPAIARGDTPRLLVFGKTDVGRYRDNNEDALGEETAPDGSRLVIVADGMGGFEAGEVASQVAVESAQRTWTAGRGGLRERLRSAVKEANDAVIRAATQEGHLGNMGTTLVLLGLQQGEVVVAHSGDSRAYVLRARQLTQMTRDHTEGQEMVERGELAPQDLESHELGHCLTRCLGIDYEIEPDLTPPMQLQQGDTFLLCSDGLTAVVENELIEQILRFFPPSEAVDVLVKLANFRGGPDNITVQVVRFGADRALEARPPDFRLDYEGFALRLAAGCLFLLALVAGIIGLVWWLATG